MGINQSVENQIKGIKNKCEVRKPLVVISCITYNHEQYIKEALEGFIIQKTNFPFVVIVHDDASTDGTSNIIKEYSKKYPDVIYPIVEEENQYSKRDGSLDTIIKKSCEVTGAKYIALCEGDDYWIDPLKLQKQIDFLEENPEYTMCFHKVNVKYENGVNVKKIPFQHLEERDYTGIEIIEKWTIPTASVVLKKEVYEKVPQNNKFQVGDNVLWLTCARYGKVRCFNDIMSVYRRQPTGYTAQNSYLLCGKYAHHTIGLIESFPELATSKVLLKNLNHQFFLWLMYDLKINIIPKTTIKFASHNLKYLKLKYLSLECRKLFAKIFHTDIKHK